MKSYITFEDGWIVKVEFDKMNDLSGIVKFENSRLASLEERGIQPKSELRDWDKKRKITISVGHEI